MAQERRTEAYYWEPLLDEATGDQIGVKFDVSVWVGDENDRPGQRLVEVQHKEVLWKLDPDDSTGNTRMPGKLDVDEFNAAIDDTETEFARRRPRQARFQEGPPVANPELEAMVE